MGLWGFLAKPLVPAAMGVTGSSHKPVHCNKGDAAYPSAVMCYLGQALARKTQFQSDNEAVITALNTKSCKDTSLMHMFRCLFFFSRHTIPSHTHQAISLVLTTHWLMLYHVTMPLFFFQRFPMRTKSRLTSPRN